jgi:hypothetical protein
MDIIQIKYKLLFLIAILIVFTFPVQKVLAGIGVGVGLGKIMINKPLSAGGIYKLPLLPVFNTGDQSATYRVFVTYLSGQKELQPDSSWFSFDPKQFTLSPRSVQNVTVTLTLPISSKQGTYFAYLEAQPQIAAIGSTVGVAAATKLQFQVANTNMFWAGNYSGPL